MVWRMNWLRINKNMPNNIMKKLHSMKIVRTFAPKNTTDSILLFIISYPAGAELPE